MSELNPEDFDDLMDEDITVSIDTEDGTFVCKIITILTVNDKDYIALLPVDEDGNESDDIWFYGYVEDPDDPDKDPELIYIEDDDELEAVSDKFDEFLDNLDFDEE